MEKEFAPYEESLAVKELGFDESCFGYYSSTKKLNPFYNTQYSNRKNSRIIEVFNDHLVTAPLYQQLFRWFREKYQLYGSITNHHSYKNEFKGNFFYIIDFELLDSLDRELKPKELFDTYEEAELACLRKLIEIVKEKKS